jgi:hypothetical protein
VKKYLKNSMQRDSLLGQKKLGWIYGPTSVDHAGPYKTTSTTSSTLHFEIKCQEL